MAFYAVDVRGITQRVTQECTGAGNRNCFVKAVFAKQAWANARSAPEPANSPVCSSCRHHHCRICEECSVGKEYSDYWICHCCGALTHRLPSLH